MLKIKTVLSNKTIQYVETKNRARKREKESGGEGRLQISRRAQEEEILQAEIIAEKLMSSLER